MSDLWVVVAAPLAFALVAVGAWTAPRALRVPHPPARLPVALIGGLLAALAPGSPTGIVAADLLMRVAFGFVATHLCARAGSRYLLASAVLGSVVAVGSPAHLVALAVTGALAAAVAVTRRRSLLTVAAAAAIVQVVLYLEWPPTPTGAPTAAAIVILAPAAVGGLRRLHRPQRKLAARAALVTVAGGSVAAGLGLVALTAARPSLETGVEAASGGLLAARSGDPSSASDALATTEASFDEAADWLGAWWARPGWVVPVLGPHLRALHTVAAAGEELGRTGQDVSAALALEGVRIEGGQVPLDRLEALRAPMTEALAVLDRTRRRLGDVDSPWLASPLADRLERETVRLADLHDTAERAADALAILPPLLGRDGPRRYFLLVQTPVESRATGGFMGNWGEITAVDGKVELTRFGRTAELNAAGDPAAKSISHPADYVARYGRFAPAATWQNVTMSPDFPSVAQVVAQLYPQSGGQPVDGVLALDPAGLAALLELTGPVDLAQWPEPLTAANAEQVLLFEQYVRFGDANADRIDFLGDAAREVWSRLTSGELPEPARITRALGPAVGDKRIMFASLRPEEDRQLRALGIAGEVAPIDGDYLGVITQNAGGNKIDWFLRRGIHYAATLDADGGIDATATITLRNEAPAAGLPDVIIGAAADLKPPPGTNRVYLSVYTPWSLTGATLQGEPLAVESERELGRNVYSAFLDLPPGSTGTVVLRLAGEFSSGGYRLEMHQQPLVVEDAVEVEVPPPVRAEDR